MRSPEESRSPERWSILVFDQLSIEVTRPNSVAIALRRSVRGAGACDRIETEPLSSPDESILRFIRASFPSVWAMELLFTLKREPRAWTREEMVASLRASELVVNRSLDALVAAGLASIESGGAQYAPVSSDVEECVEQVEQLYRTRPNLVRRAIILANNNSASAFAEAFKLRRDTDD